MLTHLKKLQFGIRLQAGLNILLLTLLTLYILRVVVFEYLDVYHDTSHRSEDRNQPRSCWFLWLTVCLVSVVIIPLQLVGDVLLMRDSDDDTLRSIQKFEQWLRISALFLLLLLLGVFLAVFCPLQTITNTEESRVPIWGLLLIGLVVATRVGALQTGRVYKSELEAIVEGGTTWETGLGSIGDCRSITPTLRNDGGELLFIT